jgi:hypothetical protein
MDKYGVKDTLLMRQKLGGRSVERIELETEVGAEHREKEVRS